MKGSGNKTSHTVKEDISGQTQGFMKGHLKTGSLMVTGKEYIDLEQLMMAAGSMGRNMEKDQ